MDTAVRIGLEIRRRRIECGLTTTALAAKMNVCERTVWMWEAGKIKTVSAAKLLRFADALDCWIGDLA